jgi:hypothetical protein
MPPASRARILISAFTHGWRRGLRRYRPDESGLVDANIRAVRPGLRGELRIYRWLGRLAEEETDVAYALTLPLSQKGEEEGKNT